MNPTSVSVFGAGSWGTSLAQTLAQRNNVLLWCRNADQAGAINNEHKNPRHLSSHQLSSNLRATTDLTEAALSDLWVLAVPTQNLRHLLSQLKPLYRQGVKLCNVSKGIELSTLLFPSGVAQEVLPSSSFSALSGPSHAEEVIVGLPAAVVATSTDEKAALLWQRIFNTDWFRVYSSTDLPGVEVGGAVKNVIAIASGFLHSRRLGDNAVAAMICRGGAEMLRLGLSMKANPLTIQGLAGMGDLMVTAYSRHSRNFRFGEKIGQGVSLEAALSSISEVAEGVFTAKSLEAFAERQNVEMPICHAVYQVLYEGLDPIEATRALLGRSLKAEYA